MDVNDQLHTPVPLPTGKK